MRVVRVWRPCGPHHIAHAANDLRLCVASPVWLTPQAILTSIQSLLSDPNPDSPANSAASKLYEEDKQSYRLRVRECVENSWIYKGNRPPSDSK